jgi:hypothetical protein
LLVELCPARIRCAAMARRERHGRAHVVLNARRQLDRGVATATTSTPPVSTAGNSNSPRQFEIQVCDWPGGIEE